MKPDLARELERRVEELGYELVEVEEAGSARRPIVRLRIDLPDSEPGKGVSLGDCTRVSRALESYIDESQALPATYVLEVSSPGVERPLVKRRDFERFAGQEVALAGKSALAGRAKRLEGELTGISGEAGSELIGLRLESGEVVEVPWSEINKAHLLFKQLRGERKKI